METWTTTCGPIPGGLILTTQIPRGAPTDCRSPRLAGPASPSGCGASGTGRPRRADPPPPQSATDRASSGPSNGRGGGPLVGCHKDISKSRSGWNHKTTQKKLLDSGVALGLHVKEEGYSHNLPKSAVFGGISPGSM